MRNPNGGNPLNSSIDNFLPFLTVSNIRNRVLKFVPLHKQPFKMYSFNGMYSLFIHSHSNSFLFHKVCTPFKEIHIILLGGLVLS